MSAVAGAELLVLDAPALAIRSRAGAPAGSVEVLGHDAAGRPVVSRGRGLSILVPPTYAEVGRFEVEVHSSAEMRALPMRSLRSGRGRDQ